DGFLADYNLPTTLYSMTAGPDQRIYLLANNGTRYMHVIHKPDEPGLACDFRQHDVQMPAISVFFLPNMPYYRLYNEPGSACDSLGVQPPLVAQWRSEPDSLSGPRTVAFTDISYFQPVSWHWRFGDGDSSSLPEPLHVYAAAGSYEVCLAVCNDVGLCDTLCRNITVQTLSGTAQPGPAEASATLWPNPANTEMWLAHPAGRDSEFRLFALDGRSVLRQALPEQSGVEGMEVKHLPKGLYIWQLCRAGRPVQSGKVIVQH
ncbi:MAG: PKD domain-containing protein, partial [Saprospiraceae bacterium]